MGIPLLQKLTVGSYVVRQHLAGRKRFPLVLMLEPLFRCNLACAGCGKIDYPREILNQSMPVDHALRAVDECGAPVVSIAGGEPLLHKQLPDIVRGIVARKKFVYLCTNALLMEKRLAQYEPSVYFTWSVHLDGDEMMHDAAGVPGRRLRARGRRHQGGEGARLPRQHQLHAVQQCRTRAGGGFLRRGHGDRRRRHHGVAGLRLRARARPAPLPAPRHDQAALPWHSGARARRPQLGIQPVLSVPRLPGRQPELSLHAVGQSDLHAVRLAEALLPPRRRLRARPSTN